MSAVMAELLEGLWSRTIPTEPGFYFSKSTVGVIDILCLDSSCRWCEFGVVGSSRTTPGRFAIGREFAPVPLPTGCVPDLGE